MSLHQTQTSAQISHGQVAQPQFTIVQAPQVQVTDGSSQDQPSTTTSQTAQVVQFQLPQGALPPATALQAPTSQEHVAGTTQLTQTSLGAQPQAAVSQTQQKSPQQQQTAQQQISQQLLTQSIPQGAGASQALQGLLQQNYAAQFGQVGICDVQLKRLVRKISDYYFIHGAHFPLARIPQKACHYRRDATTMKALQLD